MARPAGGTDQRRPAYAEAATVLPAAQRPAVRRGEPAGDLARRDHGDGRPVQRRHPDGLQRLQVAVRQPRRQPDRQVLRAAHAPVAGRAPGRHRAPGPGGQPRRHPPGEPPRARGEHRDPGPALPLRGTGALGPRRPRPAHRRRRVGGHRRPLGLRQEHPVQRPAGHPPASGGTDPHGRPGPCATGPGRPARTGRHGAAGRRAVRRFAQRQHQFLRPATGHALAAAVRADGCHPR